MSPHVVNRKPRSTTTATTTHAVRFKNNVCIKNISSHRDLSKDEKSKCWYTPQDFSIMKQEIMILIKSEIADWDELRAFGLEAPQSCKLRRANIMRAKLIVLTEQEKLWRDGVTSHSDIISMRLKGASRISREEARRRAAIAATTVRAFEQPTLEETPRSNKHESLPGRPRRAITATISHNNRPTGWHRI